MKWKVVLETTEKIAFFICRTPRCDGYAEVRWCTPKCEGSYAYMCDRLSDK